MKKKIIIGVLVLFTAILVASGVYYFNSISPVNKKDKTVVVFEVKPGEKKAKITKNLKDKGLIKNDKTALVYLFFNSDLNIQAGVYNLDKSMSVSDIFTKLHKGEIRVETLNMTFLPGKRLTEYVETISETFNYDYEEIINTINGADYLTEKIEKYWFLTDEILNDKIYYGLEGYIMPDTYEFMSNSSIDDIFTRLLDQTAVKLEPYRAQIESGNYTVHEILTMASIVELEANSETDRQCVAQVIYKRLDLDMALGMDVTTYYAEQKEMGEELTADELNRGNGYNTRNTNMSGLPVGPIGNPSLTSIDAVFNPSSTDFVYFYADVTTGKVYFAETNEEFLQIIRKVG